MLDWKKNSNGRSALLIEGARRVGKSTVIKKFAEDNYASYIMIDFSQRDDWKEIFNTYNYGIDSFFAEIQLRFKVNLHERNSVIIFDEVQRFPRAREIIKFLVADGRYDYIESGSLISLKENTKNIRIPSEEHTVKMYPMDFEEYLWACGNTVTVPLLKERFDSHRPVGTAHDELMRKFREYMIVGGMPQAVDAFLLNNNFGEADRVKKDILALYENDIIKIKSVKTSTLALSIFRKIPSILSGANKKFMPKKAGSAKRTTDYEPSLTWLSLAMLVNRCFRITDADIMLSLTEEIDRFKCYLLDTGLLMTLAAGNSGEEMDRLYREILDGELSINEGMFFENVVAQELISHGHDLHFAELSKSDGSTYEVDFVIRNGPRIEPIEVKSGSSARHRSLDVFRERYADRISSSWIVHTCDLREEGGITYIPAYMCGFL